MQSIFTMLGLGTATAMFDCHNYYTMFLITYRPNLKYTKMGCNFTMLAQTAQSTCLTILVVVDCPAVK